MTTTLDTIPASKEVTADSVDAWGISFAAALGIGESITLASAVLYTDMPPTPDALVVGFVTGVQINGAVVVVSWTGAALTRHSTYRLETQATLNTGSVIELLTRVVVVA